MGIANNKGGDDTSGLYDLKELATSAKKRRSQRLSSEMDAQQSLLQSSAALSAVALPDPKKSQEIAVPTVPLAGLDSPGSASVSSEASAATSASQSVAMQFTEQASSSTSFKGWLLAGVFLMAAAGAAAFLFLSGGSESSSAPAPALAAGGPESEIATPVQALPAVADDQDERDEPAVAEADLPEVAPLDDDTAAPADEEEVADSPRKNNSGSAKGAEKPAAESKSENKSARDDDDKDGKTRKDKPSKSEATASKQEAKEPVKTEDLDSNASVDDILSTVTGGIDEHKSVEEDKGPSKKRLERGDVAKAMKKVSPAAKACYSAEEFSGVVTVKYSVDQDGKVSGAQATGPHKSSKTGACVANAVKGASFPAFSGAAMSFSFPFLLSP